MSRATPLVKLRNTLTVTLAVGVALAVMMVLGGSAWAGVIHPYTGEAFGPQGLEAGNFSKPIGVAVDQVTGDVFVYDGGEGGKVYKFDASGEPANFSGLGTNVITGVGATGGAKGEIAVDSSSGPDAGDIYVANDKVVQIYGNDGSFLGELVGGDTCGVAVDPSGAVYVGVYPETVVKYTPVTNPVTGFDETASMEGLEGVCNVAADSEGDVYAARYTGGVTRYNASQFGSLAATGTPINASGQTLAVEPTTNDVYVDQGSSVAQYDSSGNLIDSTNVISPSFGLAVKSGGDLYVAVGVNQIDVYGPEETIGDVTVEAPIVSTTTATLKGTVNPNGVAITSCQFEYESVTEPARTAPCSPVPGSGTTPVSVSAVISGLTPDTVYQYQLTAANVNGPASAGSSFKSYGRPETRNETVSEVGVFRAIVSAGIEPNGSATTLQVEYGPTAAYGSITSPIVVNNALGVVGRSVEISGLQPGSAYHLRIVATNNAGSTVGQDMTFTTYPMGSEGLPDNRGYEKVSPNNNADGNVYAPWPLTIGTEGGYTELAYEASPDGNALAYIGMPSEEGGSGREGGHFGEQYLARRDSEGHWKATNVTPPSDGFKTIPAYQGFSADLSHGFLTTNAGVPLVPGAPAANFRVPYARDFDTGAYEPLLLATPPNRERFEFGAYQTYTATEETEPVFAGSSADFSHVLYMANDALTTNAVDGGEEDNNLYDFHNGGLTLVNVLPDGSPEPNAVFGGPVVPPDNHASNSPDFSHVISENGNRIFWTGQGPNKNIYMREAGTTTVQVDAAVGGGGQYWTATPDGSKVLFTKSGSLYEYDVASGQTTDLVPSGEVQGIVGTSEDLSYVYFVANANLAPGSEQGGCNESEYSQLEFKECGLYVLHSGQPVRFIAMLSGRDNFTSPNSFYFHDGDWQGGLADKEAEVTPDGRRLLFSSVQPLTGYKNEGTEQLFVYEFEGSGVRCISCDPTGTPPPVDQYSAFLPVSHQATYTPHWMSSDGTRVFFDSRDALVPQDTNGLDDVYEWEKDRTGSCMSEEGCVYLITGATGGEGAFLIDASSSGSDVFFTTRAQLVAEDKNENVDVYDARVDAVTPPAEPQCTGTGCQGVPSAPPVFATPSSVTYNGVGNFEAVPKTATKTKKAKTKKAKAKKAKPKRQAKKRQRTEQSNKAKGLARRRGRGHVSSARVATESNGRSK